MASTWTVKLSWDNVVYAAGSLGNPDSLANVYEIDLVVIALPLTDPLPKYNPAIDYGHFSFGIGIDHDGNSFFGFQQQNGDAEISEANWQGFFGVPTVLNTPDKFTDGGTLTVTKDFDNDLLTASCPIGTLSLTLSDMDPFRAFGAPSYLNTQPLRAHGYGSWFTLADPTFSYPEYEVSYSAKFSDLIEQENAVTYKTRALSSADPGTWYSDTGYHFAAELPVPLPEISPWWTLTQEASRQKLDSRVTLLTWPAGLSENLFVFYRRLMTPLEGKKIDLRHSTEHAAHWNAYILPSGPSDVLWQRSHDKGHSWTGGTVFAGTNAVDSPSINWAFGKLYVVWYDSTNIVQSVSSDLGTTWGMPVALSISGTNPCHLIEQQTGFSWYFYCDSDKLYVVRSGNFGVQFIDGSPILVLDPITTQTVAAQLALDGSLLVSYLDAGSITQIRSVDMGRTWGSA